MFSRRTPRLHVVLGAGDGAGAGAVEHHFDLLDLLAGQFQRVEQAGAGDDGGAVLVVVEDRDLHGLAAASSSM